MVLVSDTQTVTVSVVRPEGCGSGMDDLVIGVSDYKTIAHKFQGNRGLN